MARTLVSGVRSSWPASSASRFCWLRERRRASSIVEKLWASRPVSSRPPGGTSMSNRPLSVMASVAAVRTTIGRVTRRATTHRSRAARAVTNAPTRAKRTRRLSSTRCTSVRSRVSLTAPPPGMGTVSTRSSPTVVRAAGAACRGDQDVLGRHRQLLGGRRGKAVSPRRRGTRQPSRAGRRGGCCPRRSGSDRLSCWHSIVA